MLIKAAKRGQDLRVDMPAIGPRTVVEAARAGLSGIAIGAGSTLVLDQDETLAHGRPSRPVSHRRSTCPGWSDRMAETSR